MGVTYPIRQKDSENIETIVRIIIKGKNKIESKFRKLIVVEVPHMKLEMVLRERVVLWSMGICHKEV